MRADIIIVNYLSADDVARCLKDLGVWELGEVWVVNNSLNEPGGDSDHERLLGAMQEHPNVRLLVPPNNLGFAGGCNHAYAHSRSEIVVLINPDALVGRADLLKLVGHMREDPELGALSPAMFWNQGRSFLVPPSVPQTPASALGLALSTRVPWFARWLASKALELTKIISRQTSVQSVDFLTGAVLLVRREAARSATSVSGLADDALFDPGYFMFFEDSDLSVRLRRAGWRLGVAPHIRAVHEYRHKQTKLGLMAQSRDAYFKKCFPNFFRLTLSLALLDLIGCKVIATERFKSSLGRVASAGEFVLKSGGGELLALSPSLLARPALLRPPWLAATPMGVDEWDLLEPGDYVALIQASSGPPSWHHFERAAPQ